MSFQQSKELAAAQVPGVRVCYGRTNKSRESWVTAALPQQVLSCAVGFGMEHRPSQSLGLPLYEAPARSCISLI